MQSHALRYIVVPLLAVLALSALVIGSAAVRTNAADHLDAPTVKKDGRIDINDVYVFDGAAGHTALAMTVNPAAGMLSPTTFRQGTDYQFLVDTTGDAIEDARLVIKFESVRRDRSQAYSVSWQANGDRTSLLRRGFTGGTAYTLAGGGSVQAGVFDDPFFFDLAAFNTFKSTLLDTGTLDGAAAFCNPDGENFFAGFNVSAIVIEVPDALLGGGTVKVWGETRFDEPPRQQVERMGIPAINTVFNHTDATKEAYNRAEPRNDPANYTDDVAGLIDLITGLAGTDEPGYGEAIAGLILPDVITYDTTTTADFAMLNGRALHDDVINVALTAVTNGALTTDCVANDSPFPGAFPYLAPAN